MKISKEYRTIIIMVSGFIIISYLFSSIWLLYFGLGILFVSSINSRIAKRIAELWIGFGHLLGAINSKIILSFFFAIILVPLSYARRIFGTKSKSTIKTNWIKISGEEIINFNDPW